MAIGLSGCPVAAELENPDRFPIIAGGGSSNGGSGGSGMMDCRRPLPELPDCNWREALGAPGVPGFCAKSGCHNNSIKAGELDLTPDDLLISRLLGKEASYDVTCEEDGAMCEPMSMTCAKCSMCPQKGPLIKPGVTDQGWVFTKISPFVPPTQTTTLDIGCGDAMPTYNTTGTANYTQAHKDCLVKFFNAIAMTPGTWPCVTAGGGGSGGTGGAPMSGTGGT